jgi:hypothetical protein
MGFRRSHYSSLLKALHIPPVTDILNKSTAGLLHRIFQVSSPTRSFQSRALAELIINGKMTKNSLLARVIRAGHSPTHLVISPPKTVFPSSQDGISDTLRHLLLHDNYFRPFSHEHFLASLLLKCF